MMTPEERLIDRLIVLKRRMLCHGIPRVVYYGKIIQKLIRNYKKLKKDQ